MAAKRRAADASLSDISIAETDAAAEPIFRSDLDDLLASQADRMHESNVTLLRDYDRRQQARFSGIEAEIAAITTVQNKAADEMQKMRESIAGLERGLAVAETITAVRADLDAEDFVREPDITILRLGAASLVAKTSLAAAIATWMADASFENAKD